MPLYKRLHNLLNALVLVQIANKMGLQKNSTGYFTLNRLLQYNIQQDSTCKMTLIRFEVFVTMTEECHPLWWHRESLVRPGVLEEMYRLHYQGGNARMDGGGMFLQDVSSNKSHTASHPTLWHSSRWPFFHQISKDEKGSPFSIQINIVFGLFVNFNYPPYFSPPLPWIFKDFTIDSFQDVHIHRKLYITAYPFKQASWQTTNLQVAKVQVPAFISSNIIPSSAHIHIPVSQFIMHHTVAPGKEGITTSKNPFHHQCKVCA
jgi:hypothetical protein